MICPKCNAEIADNSSFCQNCGNALSTSSADSTQDTVDLSHFTENSANNVTPNFMSPQTPAPKKPSKAPFIALCIVIFAVIVGIVAFLVIFIGDKLKSDKNDKEDVAKGSYEEALASMYDYYNDRNTDIESYYLLNENTYVSSFNYEQDQLIAELTDNDNWEDDLLDEIEENYEYISDTFGDDWEFSYDIKKETKLKDSDLEDIQDAWDYAMGDLEYSLEELEDLDEYDIEDFENNLDEDDIEELIQFYETKLEELEDMEITEGYKIKIKQTVEGEDDEESYTDTIYMVKMNDTWTWVDGYESYDGMEYSFYFESPYLYNDGDDYDSYDSYDYYDYGDYY